MQVIAAIIAIAKAVPVIDSWLQQLVAAYTAARIASMKKENRDAIRKAVQEQDQRDLESAVGNPNPGEPSNAPGSEIISGPPPGVSP